MLELDVVESATDSTFVVAAVSKDKGIVNLVVVDVGSVVETDEINVERISIDSSVEDAAEEMLDETAAVEEEVLAPAAVDLVDKDAVVPIGPAFGVFFGLSLELEALEGCPAASEA